MNKTYINKNLKIKLYTLLLFFCFLLPTLQCNKIRSMITKEEIINAEINTTVGKIEIELYKSLAPKHVESFVNLASSGFYNGTTFHRVIPGFMIQGGDPLSKDPARREMHGRGGPGYNIPAEFSDRKHVRGILSAARSSDPNSAGSQFFIMVNDAPHLDNQYTIFGKVKSGMEVVDKIVSEPKDANDNPLTPVTMEVKIKSEK